MISILLPTRGRPDNLDRLVLSVNKTATIIPEFVVYVDDDDQESAKKVDQLGLKLVVGPRITMSDYWNKCFDHCSGDIVMQCGDDVVFKTEGWDAMVINEFKKYPDKILLVHGCDLDPWFPDFGTHSFVHRKWVETLGYFIPPYFSSDYGDTWIGEIAKFIGRIKYLPFITEHMHPRANKAQLDPTYLERMERHHKQSPGMIYQDMFEQRLADAQKLIAVIEEYEKKNSNAA